MVIVNIIVAMLVVITLPVICFSCRFLFLSLCLLDLAHTTTGMMYGFGTSAVSWPVVVSPG